MMTHWFHLKWCGKEAKRILDSVSNWLTHGSISYRSIRWPCQIFHGRLIVKSVAAIAYTSISLSKIDLNDVTKQNPSRLVDLGFAVNYDIKLLKSKKKMTTSAGQAQIWGCRFSGENVLIKKRPFLSCFARCIRCLSSVFIAKCLGPFETVFEKVLSKLINSKTIAATVSDKAKLEYHKFVTRTVKIESLTFWQQLDQFLISCMFDTKGFTELSKVIKIFPSILISVWFKFIVLFVNL